MTKPFKLNNTIDYYFTDISKIKSDIKDNNNLIRLTQDNYKLFYANLMEYPEISKAILKVWENCQEDGFKLYRLLSLDSESEESKTAASKNLIKFFEDLKEGSWNWTKYLGNHKFSLDGALKIYNQIGKPVDEYFVNILLPSYNAYIDTRNKILEANLKLVINFAKKYYKILSYADIIQEGNIGLIKAIEKFDVSMEKSFTTYAYYRIKESILKYIKTKNKLIRIPTHIQEILVKLDKIEWNEESPLYESIIGQANLTSLEIESIQSVTNTPLPLEAKFEENDLNGDRSEHGWNNLQDQLPDPAQDVAADYDAIELNDSLTKALSNYLTPLEHLVIVLRFGLMGEAIHTLGEIASKTSRSKENIRQIEKTAINKLKLNAVSLSEYLGD